MITFLIVSLLWAFFVWPSWTTALQMLGSVFTTFNYAQIPAAVAQMGLTLGDWIVLAVAVAAVCAFDLNARRVKERFIRLCPAAKTAVLAVLGLIVLTFGMYGLGFNATDFIYSRF